jgi:hypothetical protein
VLVLEIEQLPRVHVAHAAAAKALQGKTVHIILQKSEKSRMVWFVLSVSEANHAVMNLPEKMKFERTT